MPHINTRNHLSFSAVGFLVTRVVSVTFVVSAFIQRSNCDTYECTTKGNEDIPGYDPLIITSGKLAEPEVTSDGNLIINLGENFTLACPGSNNQLKNFPNGIKSAEVFCGDNNSIQFESKSYQIQEFVCTKAASSKAIVTGSSCANNRGDLVEIGYSIGEEWYPVIRVCHNFQESSSLYSEHILYGSGIQDNAKSSNNPGFQEGGLYPNISIANVYTQKAVLVTLNSTLGCDPTDQKTYLAKGHLAPRADFLMLILQNASFYYVNAVPEWQTVNAGNWVKLENLVRNCAENYKKDFNIITGVFEVLTFPDVNGTEKPIYLYNSENVKKCPVPKFIWKIVYDPVEGNGIAFIAVNNPFLKSINESYILCTDICESSGWNMESWTDASKGYLYCCEVYSLQKFIYSIPNITITTVLKFKNTDEL